MKGIHLHGQRHEHAMLVSCRFDWYVACDDCLAWLARIRQEQPNANIVVRMYDPDRMAKNGIAKAREDSGWWTATHDCGEVGSITPYKLTDHLIPDNELNLGIEHGGQVQVRWDRASDYTAIDAWKLDYVREFRRLAAGIAWEPVLHWGALSPGHDGPSGAESEYGLMVRSLKEYDVIDIHCYGDHHNEWAGGRWRRIRGKLLQLGIEMPMLITEFNAGDFGGLLRDLSRSGGMLGACWFIWSTQDPQFATMQMWNAAELVEAAKNFEAPSVGVPGVEIDRETPSERPKFVLGFREVAERLGTSVVGEPLEDEVGFWDHGGQSRAVQPTTAGLLHWRDGESPRFLTAYQE